MEKCYIGKVNYYNGGDWIMQKILRMIGALVGGIFVGALLLVIVYLLPINQSSVHAVESMNALEIEGWYPTLPLIQEFEGVTSQYNKGGILDNFTDSIMISTATMGTEGNPLYQAMAMKNDTAGGEYSYYWHGYVTVLRPLLLLFDYGEIRVINSMLHILLTIALFCLLKKRKNAEWAMLSVSVYGLVFPLALAYSLQYSWVYYIMLFVSIIMLQFENRVKRNGNIYLLMLLSGMLTSYFDLLTYPLITWAIPMIWWIALEEEKTERERLYMVVLSGFSWILGYGGMWAGKWVLGGLVTGADVIGAAFREILYRSGLQEGVDGSTASHIEVFLRNFEQCDNVQYLLILLAWFMWFMYKVLKNKCRPDGKRIYSFVLIGVSTFVWYMVLHNHTFVHISFTYRIYTILFATIFACFIVIANNEEKGKHRLFWGAAIVCAIVVALGEKDVVLNHNGSANANRMSLENGQIIEQCFVPVAGRVNALHLGIYANGSRQGKLYMELSQNGEEVATWELSIDSLKEKGFIDIPCKEKLKESEIYTMRLCVDKDDDTEVWILATDEGEYPLTEFMPLVVEDIESDCQMLGGITYEVLPGKKKLVINFVGAFGIISMVAICMWMLGKDGVSRIKKQRKSGEV